MWCGAGAVAGQTFRPTKGSMGHTLVDASTSSANVLIINPNAEEVVLPCRTSIGQLVLISAVSVARSELRLPTNTAVLLPEYLGGHRKRVTYLIGGYRSSVTA